MKPLAAPVMLAFTSLWSTAAANEIGGLRISSTFGARVDPIDRRRTLHAGLDLPARAGTPVVAAAAGVVRVAGRRGSYGNLVELAHPDGSATRYAHLSAILVRPGQAVAQGQLIARIGSTGRSTGAHLHFEYRIAGVAVNPLDHLGPAMVTPRPDRPDNDPSGVHRSRFSLARAALPTDLADLPDGKAVQQSLAQ